MGDLSKLVLLRQIGVFNNWPDNLASVQHVSVSISRDGPKPISLGFCRRAPGGRNFYLHFRPRDHCVNVTSLAMHFSPFHPRLLRCSLQHNLCGHFCFVLAVLKSNRKKINVQTIRKNTGAGDAASPVGENRAEPGVT